MEIFVYGFSGLELGVVGKWVLSFVRVEVLGVELGVVRWLIVLRNIGPLFFKKKRIFYLDLRCYTTTTVSVSVSDKSFGSFLCRFLGWRWWESTC